MFRNTSSLLTDETVCNSDGFAILRQKIWDAIPRSLKLALLERATLYMNPTTGSVDTEENWVCECGKGYFDILVEVTWSEKDQNWVEK